MLIFQIFLPIDLPREPNKISGKFKINRFNLPAGRQECGTQHIQAVGINIKDKVII